MAIRAGVEPASSDRQSDIIAVIPTNRGVPCWDRTSVSGIRIRRLATGLRGIVVIFVGIEPYISRLKT